jgi:putative FmdB family regulatory protein
MPLYEYICTTCGNAFEHFVRTDSSQEAVTCPKCTGTEVSKQFSTFGMKGAGGFSRGSGASASHASCSTGGG